MARVKYIGAHVASEPTVAVAPREAAAIGATAFAFNLVAPQRWSTPAYPDDVVEAFRSECAVLGFRTEQILPHSAFVINLGGPDARKRAMSRRLLIDELHRCRRLGLTMLNLHPGAHLGAISESESIALIADNLNAALDASEGVTAVLENTAGQGSNLGYTFDQLAEIISRVEDKSRVGVCIDTAHAFAAGYNLADSEGYEAMWREFDETLGAHALRGMHINDSMRPLGSRIDRHAPLGSGHIGAEAFYRLIDDPRTDGIPLILETPDPEAWREVISRLKDRASQS
ncbi:MAG: deoxyribonuclease IV [Muribaculaceae bacterium]|nr:deoxyribonuclease IV [Muribaculaceae bacterium]